MTSFPHAVDRSSPLSRFARAAEVLDVETERALVRRVAAGCPRALDRLVRCHLRMVYALAKEFTRFGVPLEDLVAEGSLGLVEAARRVDPSREARFSSYAGWWIRAHLREFTLRNRRIVAMPSTRNARRVLACLRNVQATLAQSQGGNPSADDVATAIGVRVDDVWLVERALSARDLQLADDVAGGVPVASFMPSPEDEACRNEEVADAWRRLVHVIDALEIRERQIMELRWMRDEAVTFTAIASELGVTRQRVKQIETRVVRKICRAMETAQAEEGSRRRAAAGQ